MPSYQDIIRSANTPPAVIDPQSGKWKVLSNLGWNNGGTAPQTGQPGYISNPNAIDLSTLMKAYVPNGTDPSNPNQQNILGSTAQSATAFTDLLPYFQRALNQQITPNAQAQLDAAKATSPGYNQLMLDLIKQYGPQLSQIGSQLQGQNVANANTILGNQGTDLLKTGYNASQIFDKPYYQSRDAAATQLQNLLQGSSDISGNLTGSEQNQIAQGLAREGVQRGTANAPSNIETVANATQYGNAAFQRQQTEKSALSNAIQTATSFLPASKSGVNVFDTVSGTAGPNMGTSQFQGINTNMGTPIGPQVLQGQQQIGAVDLGGQYSQNMNSANIKANQKDWADYLSQVSSSIGSIVGGVAGAAACWVAREVYGSENPTWMKFRTWILNDAPKELKDMYLENGEFTADVIRFNPLLKYIIKEWMDSKLNNNAK